ncbi:MAG: hypothetical protein J6X95_01670, partial [Treponema sp.]|nr:hypothetical protein [Treponema sp.]
ARVQKEQAQRKQAKVHRYIENNGVLRQDRKVDQSGRNQHQGAVKGKVIGLHLHHGRQKSHDDSRQKEKKSQRQQNILKFTIVFSHNLYLNTKRALLATHRPQLKKKAKSAKVTSYNEEKRNN